MDIKVSIIIPVYNVAKYIERCIESINHQVYSNIEVILIDDGSTDESKEICERIMRKHLLDIRLICQNNSGVSEARNTGLRNVSGDYFTFIDADDWVEENYISDLIDIVRKYNADLVLGNAKVSNGKSIIKSGMTNNSRKLNKQDAIRLILEEKELTCSCWGNIYASDFIKKIKFDTRMRIGEDFKFVMDAIEVAKSIYLNARENYIYYLSPNSAVRSEFSTKWFDEIHFCEQLLSDYRFNELRSSCLKRYIRVNLECYIQLYGLDSGTGAYLKNLKINMLNHERKYLLDKSVSLKQKLKLYSVLHLPITISYWKRRIKKYYTVTEDME